MRTSQEKADEAIQKLMIKEGGGKLTVPKSVEVKQSKMEQPKMEEKKRKEASGKQSGPEEKSNEESPRKKRKLNNGNNDSIEPIKTRDDNISPLRDVFKGDRIFISSRIPERDVLSRYVTAYGGDIVQDKILADVIVLSKKVADQLGRIVTKQWIIDKINHSTD